MIKCSRCGLTFNCKSASRKYTETLYYFCGGTLINNSRDHKTKPCRGVLRGEWLDNLVWEKIVEALKEPERILATCAIFKRLTAPKLTF